MMTNEHRDIVLKTMPLLAMSLAVTYDVGYFWGIDIAFFSTFSLTEHIVFAMQALPLALLVAALTMIVGAWVQRVRQAEDRNGVRRRGSRRLSRIYLANCVAYGAAAVIALIWHFYLLAALLGAIVVLCAAIIVLVRHSSNAEKSNSMLRRFSLTSSAFFLGITIVFISGYLSGSLYLKLFGQLHTIERNDGNTIKVVLVRTGERGVLAFDRDANEISLQKWDAIRRISIANEK